MSRPYRHDNGGKDFRNPGRDSLNATTLHTLLKPKADFTTFKHNRENPFDIDWLIVDAAGIIDLPMMAKLLDALPSGCRLTLVGDEFQLASVECGRIYGDLCNAPRMHDKIARLSVGKRFKDGGEVDALCECRQFRECRRGG